MPIPTTFSFAAYVLMFFGLIGSVVPIVPGPLLIWLGALLWAWADGFQALGWPTLVVLGVIMVLAWSSDLLLTALFSRQLGVSWKAIAGAIVGGLAGGLLFGSFVPIIGTLLATISGGIVGILFVEYYDKRNWQQAIQAGKGYIIGFLASSALEGFLALLMILIFAWQAFF